MSIKVGTDIVSIKRVDKSINRFGKRFLKRFLLQTEIESTFKIETIAGYWASKEAIAKALGCGIGKELSFLDIEIKKDIKNTPYFELNREIANRFGLKESSLSISHDGGFALAVAVIVLI